ncbi:MAG: four helix bundle protein [Chlorobiaceae bacterium]|nr:four helix bundle protein [Chlorobiaceae bacterium]
MGKKIERFEDLEVWQKAIDIAVDIYRLSESGKLSKDYDSKSQIRRAANSISNNIAEGFEYNNNSEFVRFLKYAKGSAGEVRNQLHLLKKIGYIDEPIFDSMYNKIIELSQQIANFIKYLRKFETTKKPK